MHNMKEEMAFVPFILTESYLKWFWTNKWNEGHRIQQVSGQVPKFYDSKIQIIWTYVHLNNSKNSPMVLKKSLSKLWGASYLISSWVPQLESSPLKSPGPVCWQIWFFHCYCRCEKESGVEFEAEHSSHDIFIKVSPCRPAYTRNSMDFLHTLSNCADNLHLGNLDGSLCGLIPADLPASNFVFIENSFLTV